MPSKLERTRLIGEIVQLLEEETITHEARAAALTFVGWLARRMPGECACQKGLDEMVERAEKVGAGPKSGRAVRKSG